MENKEEVEIKPIKVKENKEYIKEYNKKYYAANRTKALAYMAKKHLCDVCKCTISTGKKSQHFKSKKHATNSRIKELEAQVKQL